MQILNKEKFSLALIASLYFLYYLHTSTEWHFIDAVNLIIHEAGHPLFFFFGTFMSILGGSVLQILVPIVCTFYFFLRKDFFSGSLLLFWVGQSIVNVSTYARDAITMELPLLGGDSVGHDWNNILSTLGLLPHTTEIANGIYGLGLSLILLAIYFSIALSQREGA